MLYNNHPKNNDMDIVDRHFKWMFENRSDNFPENPRVGDLYMDLDLKVYIWDNEWFRLSETLEYIAGYNQAISDFKNGLLGE